MCFACRYPKYWIPIFLASFVCRLAQIDFDWLMAHLRNKYTVTYLCLMLDCDYVILSFWWRHQLYIRYLRWLGRSILIQYSEALCIFQMYYTRTTLVLHRYPRNDLNDEFHQKRFFWFQKCLQPQRVQNE